MDSISEIQQQQIDAAFDQLADHGSLVHKDFVSMFFNNIDNANSQFIATDFENESLFQITINNILDLNQHTDPSQFKKYPTIVLLKSLQNTLGSFTLKLPMDINTGVMLVNIGQNGMVSLSITQPINNEKTIWTMNDELTKRDIRYSNLNKYLNSLSTLNRDAMECFLRDRDYISGRSIVRGGEEKTIALGRILERQIASIIASRLSSRRCPRITKEELVRFNATQGNDHIFHLDDDRVLFIPGKIFTIESAINRRTPVNS